MITLPDLQEAIAECQGQRHPDANTCIKLAAFLTIRKEMFGEPEVSPGFTYAAPQVENSIDYESDTEFGRIIRKRNPYEVWPVMDELMTTLEAIYPRLYDSVIRELS